MRTRNGGWPFQHPPNCDFGINLASEQARGLRGWISFVNGRWFMWPPHGKFISGTYGLGMSAVGWGLYSDGTSALDLRTSPLSFGVGSAEGSLVIRAELHNRPASAQNSLFFARRSSSTGEFVRLLQTGFSAGDPFQMQTRIISGDWPVGVVEPTTDVYTIDEHSVWAGNWARVSGNWYCRLIRADSNGVGGWNDGPHTYAAWGGDLDEFFLFDTDAIAATVVEGRLYNRWLSDDEVRAMYEPPSRWELYEPRVPLWNGWTAPASLPVWTSPANHADMSSTPTLEFTSAAFTGDTHFNIELDKVNTFDGGDLRKLKTNHSITGWQYWDGDSWEAFPSTGLPDAFSGNDVRHTVQTELSTGTWYRRVRQG